MKEADFLVKIKALEIPWVFILIYLGRYNKIPFTGWGINNTDLFLIVLQAGSSRCWWKPSSWFTDSTFLLCLQMVKANRSSLRSLLKELILFLRTPWPNHLSKALAPNTITLGVRISNAWILRGYNSDQSSTFQEFIVDPYWQWPFLKWSLRLNFPRQKQSLGWGFLQSCCWVEWAQEKGSGEVAEVRGEKPSWEYSLYSR